MAFRVCFDRIRAICVLSTGTAASALHHVLRPDGTSPLFVGPNKELFCSSTSRVEQTEYVTFPLMS